MDKELQKLMSEYDVSEELLSNSIVSIEVDVSGCRKEIVPLVEQSNLSYEDSDEDNMDAKDLISIGGSGASVFQLLSYLQSTYGPDFTVGVFVLAASAIVFMSIREVRRVLLKQIKEEAQSIK